MTENNLPATVLGAMPTSDTRIRRFLDDTADSPSGLLSDPPVLRADGFDMTTGSPAELVDGGWLEVGGDRKLLRLYQDGTLLFRGSADPEFLAWGQDEEEFLRQPRLNPIAVVECVSTFVLLYGKLITTFVKEPPAIEVTVQIRNAEVNGKRVALTKYYSLGIRNVYHPRLFLAHSPTCQETLRIATNDFQSRPAVIAYRILATFYSFFDMESDLIPFVSPGLDSPAIDFTMIAAL